MLKGKVLDHLRAKSNWPDYIWEGMKDIDGLIAAVGKTLVPVIGGRMTDEPPSARNTSKVGGVPDVPNGFAALDERALKLGSSLLPEERNDSGFPVKKRFDGSIERALDTAIDASG